MCGFDKDVIAAKTGDGRNFSNLETFSYTAKDGTVYTVPIGSTTDGASTPSALWATIPPFGKYWLSAWLHDYFYRSTQIAKELADELLFEAMLSEGVSMIEAKIIYEGVKLCGLSSFREDRAAQTATAEKIAA